ncbi:AMP-binding protein [Paraglaciecola sp.]|uniref:AMP-binding protein n=1 Tax=Paraglaciecola sp. TaxID=1920173 RepID=UPI003EF24C80
MISLQQQLESLPVMGQLVLADKTVPVAQLLKDAAELRSQNSHLAQQKVALIYTDLSSFITCLIAFDAWCKKIYLCPSHELIPEVDGLVIWPKGNLGASSATNLDSNLDVKAQVKSSKTQVQTQTDWYMATSGTTGEPKWFSHKFASLTSSIKHSKNLQSLTWALMYQAYRFAGLQVVLQALLSGADLVQATNEDPIAQVAIMQKHKVTAISATPSLWRQLLMTNKLNQLSLRNITLGGEIVDQTLLDQLHKIFSGAKIRHIYASTEAGMGFVVTDGQAGFPLVWLDDCSGLPVELKVSNADHLMVKPSQMPIKSPSVTIDSQGYMDTQDKVQIVNGRVMFLGRASGTINVGGNKVHPEKVEQVLLQCSDINQARVYGKKSALMGELVVADVRLSNEKLGLKPQNIKLEALKLCKKLLQRFEIPTKINIVDEIAYDPSGKLNRKLN